MAPGSGPYIHIVVMITITITLSTGGPPGSLGLFGSARGMEDSDARGTERERDAIISFNTPTLALSHMPHCIEEPFF